MGRLLRVVAASILMFVTPVTLGARQVEEEERHADLLHADLPLWGTGENLWPQHFTDGDSFGCRSPVAFGDWQILEDAETSRWWRVANYGVFHCALVLSEAHERADLDQSESRYAFWVRLGAAATAAGKIELWALQIGTRPGSDYTLLARPVGTGRIDTFQVLQRRCPRGHLRHGPSLDSWRTDYCAVSSRARLLALAKRMAKLPPLATATRVSEEIAKP